MKTIFSPAGFNDIALAANYDELPLWSAPFGLKLLEAVCYSKPVEALDIGCGSGFPLLELAQRFGDKSHFTGIDVWAEGLDRIRSKVGFYQIGNVDLILASAEKIPIENESITMITSNNGLNNVLSPKDALSECYRISKKGATMIFTANLPGTMSTFYEIFKSLLQDTGFGNLRDDVDKHIDQKRKSPEEMSRQTEEVGFNMISADVFSFRLKFSDGTAFLNHHLIRLHFLHSWLSLIPEDNRVLINVLLERKLNQIASKSNGLHLEIPFCVYKAMRKD
ncbi:MAG: class I SAM-dependent methyltransferase [Bacteroidota bacterium]